MGDFLDKATLITALSPTTAVQIFDDDADGVADDAPIDLLIDRVDGEVWSYLVGHYTLGDDLKTDRLLRSCALDFAVALSFERHPEYVRSFGEEKRAERFKRATDRMIRIKEGIQRPKEAEAAPTVGPSKTVGGIVNDAGGRMYLPNADGTPNAGDF